MVYPTLIQPGCDGVSRDLLLRFRLGDGTPNALFEFTQAMSRQVFSPGSNVASCRMPGILRLDSSVMDPSCIRTLLHVLSPLLFLLIPCSWTRPTIKALPLSAILLAIRVLRAEARATSSRFDTGRSANVCGGLPDPSQKPCTYAHDVEPDRTIHRTISNT